MPGRSSNNAPTHPTLVRTNLAWCGVLGIPLLPSDLPSPVACLPPLDMNHHHHSTVPRASRTLSRASLATSSTAAILLFGCGGGLDGS